MANDFLPFSTGGGANVYTNAEYVADTDQVNGNQPGIAKSKLVNKALRQCSIISTVVAQYIADITGANAIDDGTTATLLADMKTATSVSYNTHAAASKTTPADADEIPLLDSTSAFSLKKLTWLNLKNALTTLFAPTASPAFTGTPTINGSNVISNSTLRTELNATGTAPIYACRAWVNFNGTGTVAIRGSGNVSSITDIGVGIYAVNFTTAMPDANYSVNSLIKYRDTIGTVGNVFAEISDSANIATTMATTSCRISALSPPSTLTDCSVISASFFR